MNLIASVITFVGIFLLMVCAGSYLKHKQILPEESAGILSKLIMELVYPSLIFYTVATAKLESDLFFAAGAFDIALLIAGVGAYLIAKCVLKLERHSLAPVVLASMFSGTSLIGTAMLKVVFNGHPEYVSVGVVVSALSNGFLLNSLGVFIGARLGSDHSAGLAHQIRDFALSKPILALGLGLVWNCLGLPVQGEAINVFFGALALVSTSLPLLAALVTGISFQLPRVKGTWSTVLLVGLCQLVIQPIAFYVVAEQFGMMWIYEQIGVLMTSLGASPVVVVICNRYRCNTQLASVLVVTSTIFSALSLPISAYFISS